MAEEKALRVPLSAAELEALRALAKESFRTAPMYVRQLIRRHLREVERGRDRAV